MSQPSRHEIEGALRSAEQERLMENMTAAEKKAGKLRAGYYLFPFLVRKYLSIVAMFACSVGAALISLVLVYLIVVWLLHVEFHK